MLHAMKYLYSDNLQSLRLHTRKLTLDDVSAWTEFIADEEAMQFFPQQGELTSYERSALWVQKQLDRYAENRFGLQALINKDTGEFVGQCGLLTQEIDGGIKLEVGYHIFKKYWGKGYAPEAAKLFINFVFENDISEYVISIIHIDNLKSQRVAEKNGLKRVKQLNWMGIEVFIYRIEQNSM